MSEADGGEVGGTLFEGVFGVFAGESQGAVATSDEALHEVGGDGEGRWALAGVEDAEASAGAGTDVEEATTELEAGGDGIDGLCDVRELCLDGSGDLGVFGVDDGEEVEGGELVEVLGGRVAGLCQQVGEGGLVWVGFEAGGHAS